MPSSGSGPSGSPSPLDQLAALPSAGAGHWPTPLHRLERFSREIGREIWIKRDDVQGVALAGNKLRKFDLVLGRAAADGCDTLVTTGAGQSNSARTGAAVAATLGMASVLVLSGDRPAELTGNLLLDGLLGAELRFVGDLTWPELNREVERVVTELAAAGRRPVAAPVGCSSPLGTLGFARAFGELDAQLAAVGLEPSAVVHTSTSGGTHAGLLVGRAAAGREVRLVAVDAGSSFPDHAAGCLALAREAAALIGLDLALTADEVEVEPPPPGDRYGVPSAEATAAITQLARTEAIVTDPVYSGKGLAGLLRLLRSGRLGDDGRPVVFWHTGGYHALFDPHYAASVVAR